MFCTFRPIFIAFGQKPGKLCNILQLYSDLVLPSLNFPIFEATQILLLGLVISKMHIYGLHLTQTVGLAKKIPEKNLVS